MTNEVRDPSTIWRSNGWYDHHNKGTYTQQIYGGDVSDSCLIGDGKYTDHMTFTLTAAGSGCKIEACSQSQVSSSGDQGTNYCNTKLLFCGSADGCKVANSDFTSSGETTKKEGGASAGISNCWKTQHFVA